MWETGATHSPLPQDLANTLALPLNDRDGLQQTVVGTQIATTYFQEAPERTQGSSIERRRARGA
jgi:hypothetical protein